MIRLQILSGKQAGTHKIVRRFPFRMGRLKGLEFESDEPGVWDRHLELHLDSARVSAISNPEAGLLVNDEPVIQKHLRIGDVLTVGSLKLRFWLDDARQKGGTVYEILNVFLWLGVLSLEVWLIWRFAA